jgi:hypothetical protein
MADLQRDVNGASLSKDGQSGASITLPVLHAAGRKDPSHYRCPGRRETKVIREPSASWSDRCSRGAKSEIASTAAKCDGRSALSAQLFARRGHEWLGLFDNLIDVGLRKEQQKEQLRALADESVCRRCNCLVDYEQSWQLVRTWAGESAGCI